jgi:hypothetical protein
LPSCESFAQRSVRRKIALWPNETDYLDARE